MAAPRRTAFQRERDLLRTADLYCRGVPQAVIAQEIGVARQQIGYDVATLLKRWRAQAGALLTGKAVLELAKVDNLERTYWDAWERSKSERQISQTQKVGARGAIKALLRKEGSQGNPAFLAGVMSCIERRCKLLGLDAPEKREISGPGGGPVEVWNERGLNLIADPEGRQLVTRLLERMAEGQPQPGEPGDGGEPGLLEAGEAPEGAERETA